VANSKIGPAGAFAESPLSVKTPPVVLAAKSDGPSAVTRLFEARRDELDTSLAAGEDGLALGRRNSRSLDVLVRTVYREVASKAPEGVALVAVGSHGRGAVARHSDADLRILVPPKVSDLAVTGFAEALLYPLWDAGLAVGHQVIGQAELLELAQQDLASATALLDMRHLEGSGELLQGLLARAYEGLFAEEGLRDFVLRLEKETEARHERFGGSVYLLEPDVKSGAGGLRDLDGARWAARARFQVGEGSVGTSPWAELVRLGVLVTREEAEITEAEEFLWRVRNRLHAHAGRRSDRLTFDEQEIIALELGYGGDSPEGHSPEGHSPENALSVPHLDLRRRAAEGFMQDYYVYARAVSRAREQIFERASVRRRPNTPLSSRLREDLGPGVFVLEDAVTLSGATELAQDPALALRVYAAAVKERSCVHAYARSTILRQAADPVWCGRLRESAEAKALFVELVSTVAEVRMRRGSILGELHDAGLLLAMIPEFLPVTGRVHHDVYHVYTVDVHSVASVDCLRALFRGQMAQDQPVASGLAAEVARPKPLFLATLLHDVGKGYPDATGSRKNHSRSGAELCDVILPRLGMNPDDVALAHLLVDQHLAMYHAATRRDTTDPATIEDFCRPLVGRESLRALYLLTIADLTTPSPTAMTSWKARMLEELFLAADRYLAENQGASGEERAGRAALLSREAARLWSGSPVELSAFLESMPYRYLTSNDAKEIVAHARVSQERRNKPAHAAIVPSAQNEFAELCVVAEDAPGLLARIAAVITAARLEVFAAQVYSRVLKDGKSEALDLFWVRDRVDGKAGVERRLPSLVRDLEEVSSGKVTGRDFLKARAGDASLWRERPSPAIPTEVVVDDRASPNHTVVEVFAKDRPGLLHVLAETLHTLGLSIALSKINTEGTRVADVFYVREIGGEKVRPGERFRQIKDALVAAVEGL
jgi:[protein-PII] uridylyltransferase